jgi:hypothetical protein
VLAVDPTAIAGVVVAVRRGQNRACYGWSGRRGPNVAGEPRQVISRFRASTADPDSFRTCAVPRISRPMTTYRIGPARPTRTAGSHTAQTPELHLGRQRVAPSDEDGAPPGPRCACPAVTAASEPRVHQTVNPKHVHQLRPNSSALWPNAAPSRPSLPLIRRVRFDRPDERRRAARAGLSLAR